MNKINFSIFILLMLIIGLACDKKSATNSEEDTLFYIDTHSQPPYPELGDAINLLSIIQSMDKNNVSLSILSARVEMQYSNDIAAFAVNNPDRIIAAISLKLATMNTDSGFIADLTKQLETNKFKAVAEMLLYHAEKFDNGVSVAPEFMVNLNDPKVEAVINACAQLNCPVFFHIEFASLETKYGKSKRDQYMNELKQILTSNPNQEFILIHVAELLPETCRSLLNTYENIYFTTNFTDLKIICTGEAVNQYSESEWNALFTDHPDRFILAFDRVFPNQWKNYDNDMAYFQEKLSDLQAETAKAIAYDNAMMLFNVK